MWVTFTFKKWKFWEGGGLTAVHYILFVVEVFSETTQCFFFVFLFFNYQPWNNYTKAPIIK